MSKKKQYGEWDESLPSTQGKDKVWEPYKACYHSHPGLKFTALDGVEYTIYGGNCSTPVVYDADIYIGFAYSVSNPSLLYPWDEGYKVVEVINYPITDMAAPANPASFKKLVDWACNQLQSGKKIHAGCIGGHGRTGMFLVAVVAQMAGTKDAIQFVRKHYCKKAVETDSQVEFMIQHYGVSKVAAVKKFGNSAVWDNDKLPYTGSATTNGYQGSSGGKKQASLGFSTATRCINPVQSPKVIW
jgi:hypothetical protein